MRIYDHQVIRDQLEKDRPWTAYALADLEPGYFENTGWYCDATGSALTLLYRGFSNPILYCIEQSGNLSSVFDEIDSQAGGHALYVVVREETMPLIRARYHMIDERPMLRMMLAEFCNPSHSEIVTRLNRDHLGAVHTLYGQDPPEFFLDQMVHEGIYFGIFEGPDLVAIAGTHIVSPTYKVAGLGNIYTRADRRRRGHSTQVTAAVTSELLRMGTGTIVLNVREENAAAIRVYDRLGFKTYCRYFEMAIDGTVASSAL